MNQQEAKAAMFDELFKTAEFGIDKYDYGNGISSETPYCQVTMHDGHVVKLSIRWNVYLAMTEE